MKKIIAAMFAVMLVGVFTTPAMASTPANDKVTICHVTPSGQQNTLSLPADQANGHITGDDKDHKASPVKDYWGECVEDPKPPVVAPVAPTVVDSAKCEVNGSVTPAVTANVVYVVGGTSPTAITVTATPAQGFKFAGESQQVVYGPYDVSADKCPTPEPTPTPTPTVTPEPPAGPPAPPKDYCDNLEGVQWENYDCNTGQVVPVPEPTPTTVPQQPEGIETLPPTEPPVVTVPDKPVVPEDVPAGDGSSQNEYPWFALAIGAIIGGIVGAAIGAYNLKSK